jgi:hypothetical protein
MSYGSCCETSSKRRHHSAHERMHASTAPPPSLLLSKDPELTQSLPLSLPPCCPAVQVKCIMFSGAGEGGAKQRAVTEAAVCCSADHPNVRPPLLRALGFLRAGCMHFLTGAPSPLFCPRCSPPHPPPCRLRSMGPQHPHPYPTIPLCYMLQVVGAYHYELVACEAGATRRGSGGTVIQMPAGDAPAHQDYKLYLVQELADASLCECRACVQSWPVGTPFACTSAFLPLSLCCALAVLGPCPAGGPLMCTPKLLTTQSAGSSSCQPANTLLVVSQPAADALRNLLLHHPQSRAPFMNLVLEFLCDIARGMAYIHDRGVIHGGRSAPPAAVSCHEWLPAE